MEQLTICIVAAEDIQVEKQAALGLIADLNADYKGKLELRPVDASDGIAADLIVVIVWAAPDPALSEAFTTSTAEKRIFKKTSLVPLDLSDRAGIADRLEQKQQLDALLAGQANDWKTVLFDSGIVGVLESELKSLINARLGVAAEALNLRPHLGDTYLERSRLLKLLPDSSPHVVVLEAPYGYGKSVLAAQWAAQLEADDWRIVWVTRESLNPELTPLLAPALGVAADTPPALLREHLRASPTLLVLEDLQGDEDLSLVLADLSGLILLASRTPIVDETLATLGSAGHVTRLGASELAFNLNEAQHLSADAGTGAALHAQTLGWALPLHIASLTGTTPDAASLLAGIRASVSEAGWRELLFLTALPFLPQDAANAYSTALVAKGFVQRLGTGLRLHPFIADLAFETQRASISKVVQQEADRLPLLLQGEAFERCQDTSGLVTVLEASEAELWRHAPTRLIAWDEKIAGEASFKRHLAVGAAHNRLANFDAAILRLDAALAQPGLSANEQLSVLRHLCVPLAVQDNTRGQQLIKEVGNLVAEAEPELAGRFLGNASIIYAYAGDYEAALDLTERALEVYPSASEHRLGAEINAALHRFSIYGDYDRRLQMQRSSLDKVETVYPVQAVGQCRDIAMFYWWQGNYKEARHYLERARAGENHNAAIALEARGALAFLDGDALRLDSIASTARLFDNSYLNDVVSMYRIFLLGQGGSSQARYIYEQSPQGVFAASAYARVLAEQGETEAALALLDAHGAEADRTERLYLFAARYAVTRAEADLQAFTDLTMAGTRLLPGLVPLDTLPDKAELARYYPVNEVLASGWKDAINLRQADIPDLELTLFAKTSATLLGQALELTDRQKQILVLLTLGLNRDRVAEAMWPEADVKKQRNNLNVQLNSLRKLIEPWSVASYLFEDGLRRVSSDYGTVQTALTQADAATVFRLYREPFAAGLDLSNLDEERERLREDVVSLLFEASTPDEDSASDYLSRVLELEPLHEDALQALLRQLLRRGRRREARRRYQRFADLLAEEMGLEPLAETRRLLEQGGT